MSRYSRINAIWKKELTDTLRDRRTVIAMVVVPIVLYPGMILASLMAFEVKTTQLKQETYRVAVRSEGVQRWLRRMIDTDMARRNADRPVPADELERREKSGQDAHDDKISIHEQEDSTERAKSDVRQRPPDYEIVIAPDLPVAVAEGLCHVGIDVNGPPPSSENDATASVAIVLKEKEIRSEIAASGLEAVFERAAATITAQRLSRIGVNSSMIQPIQVIPRNVATQQEMDGWFAGLMIPPILIILTITGTIYPAIDLTAGERERGTLETLMVAPVPNVDLITGKFIVVTLIGLISALLNLAAFGATMYFGGMGQLLTQGWKLTIPPSALPWTLAALVPLAVMFGAILLAVSSFARSFKEAQNYVMPVIMAALLPAFIGVMPGTRLEGPILIMPVANIVVLTRELFMGHFRFEWIVWVVLSTSLYAGAAVAIAARLFGQEAVLFADGSSIKTMLRRVSFAPRSLPTTAQAMLVLAIAYPLNFFVQNAFGQAEGIAGTERFLYALAIWMLMLFVLLPLGVMKYTRVEPVGSLALRRPPLLGILSGLCLGCSTWILILWWQPIQEQFLQMDEQVTRQLEQALGFTKGMNAGVLIFFLAIVPAFCEELFFRGYLTSGLRNTLGGIGAVIVVALAFGIFHGTIHRLITTVALGLLFGVLAVRWGSVWPGVLAHMMHNGLILALQSVPQFKQWLDSHTGAAGNIPPIWAIGAALLVLVGMALSFIPTLAPKALHLAHRTHGAPGIET